MIELLVVIAIIGILASVVLASLNSARGKGQAAAIKSNLRNMIPQAELSYNNNGNYTAACTDVSSMISSISSEGGTAACYSGYSNDNWGASAKINGSAFEAFAADPTGVVTYDAADQSGTMNWAAAKAACSAEGGKLPTAEELKTLYSAFGSVPTGFQTSNYWSSTTTSSGGAYSYDMSTNAWSCCYTGYTYYVRCVH